MNRATFKCSLWNNSQNGWGITIGRINARKHFHPSRSKINVEFEGRQLVVALDRNKGSRTFWGDCPEFRHPAIRQWVKKHNATVENMNRYQFKMEIIEPYMKFRLVSVPDGDDVAR